MAYWAEIDENNIVIRVLKTGNHFLNEGHDFLKNNLGGKWIQTSYNSFHNVHFDSNGLPDEKLAVRKNFATSGMIYNEALDAFIFPKPDQFPSWVLNEEKGCWEPPIPYPGKINTNPKIIDMEYIWDEPTLSWVKFVPTNAI